MASPILRAARKALLLAAAAPAQEPILLRLPLQQGQQQAYCQTTDLRLSTDLGGQRVETALTFAVTMDQRVIAVRDGLADVDQTVRRLCLRLQNPRLQVDFDSDQPDAPGSNAPVLGTIAQLLGKTFRMTIDDRGRISEVRLPAGVDQALGEALGSGDPARFFAQNLPQLPERPVHAAGSWETRTALALGQTGTAEVKVQNRVLGAAGSRVEIAHVLQPDPGRLGLPRDTKMSVQRAAGTTLLDLATGQVVSSDLQLELRLQGTQAGFAMDSRVRLVQSRRLLEPPPRPASAPAASGCGG